MHIPRGPGKNGPPGSLRLLATAAVVALGAAMLPASAAAAAPTTKPDIDAGLLAELDSKGATGMMIYLKGEADVSGAAKLKDSDAKAEFVYKELVGYAEKSQQGLRASLEQQRAQFKPFWIANAIWVQGDRTLLNSISSRTDILKIEPSKTYPVVDPVTSANGTKAGINAVEWNISNIEAPRVWSEFGVRGEGIVVANIDTGVQYNHPAVVGKYRGNLGNNQFDHNYNWFDPASICSPSTVPCDNNGHGTHTMGTMVGDDGGTNQIGVAPGAKWFAAKGCEVNTCTDASLLGSAQFVLAPTDLNGQNPRPDLHADIVNNSWGGGGGDLWYEQAVDNWVDAGIFPQFSIGNTNIGEAPCGSAGSPGDYPQSYGAGAYDINNVIGIFSNRGPGALGGEIKPNIAAPGVSVRSSVPSNSYANFSGTSMASPHVAATVALMWSAAPGIRGNIESTRALLDDTATDTNDLRCGGTLDDNNIFGEGRLNAYQAVLASPRAGTGRIAGIVTNAAGGAPLSGAEVSTGNISAITGADGRYSLLVEAGTHTVTASKYGFATKSDTVTVAEGGGATLNFALTAVPLVTVSGRVTDGSGKGWPLYAKIEVAGRPGGPQFTNPANGRYSFDIASGSTYSFTVTAQYAGYQTVTQDVVIGSGNKTQNFAVRVDPACTAAGYEPSFGAPVLRETFDSTSAPDGWSVVNRTASGGWAFTDRGNRGNLTGGSGGFAMMDSDFLGTGNTQDSDLITPALDFSGVPAPYVRFNSDYRAFPNSTVDIDVSTDGGTNWTNVWRQTTVDRRGPRVEEVALSGAGGDADARVRFRYRGTFAWWWELDNVEFLNRACTPVTGGLVVGFTNDKNTGTGLNGVTVTSSTNPAVTTVSAATPDDPNIGDGFYHLFSSATGTQSFTASKAPYVSLTKSTDVADGGTKQLNFALAAPRLTVNPTNLEAHVPYGASRSTTVTIKNTGTAPASVEILERAGAFNILSQKGSPLVERKVTGLSNAQNGIPGAAGVGVTGPAPQIDPAWTRVANYPVSIFDNSAAWLDGKIYSVGGGTAAVNRTAFVYDPATDSYAALPNLPVDRQKPAAVAVDGKLYVISGWGPGGVPRNTVDVYDPASNSWSTLPATNPKPTSAAGVGVANGKVYLVGGCTNSNCDEAADLVIFDPATGSFSTGASYPHTSSWMSCGGINDKIYCAGGVAASAFTDGFVYDPNTDSWSPIANMPVDLWASQFSTANGLLVISGGVTAGSTAITNRAVAYDPAANAWINLPNAQFTRFRGAGACGFFKLGGSPDSFVAAPESETLGGLGECASGGAVDWLAATPETFTLGAGASKNVTVTVTATAEAGVLQPGRYTAQLGIQAATPYSVPSVNVTMNVSPPPNWGKIQGTVLGQGCTGSPVAIQAFIRIQLQNNPEIGVNLRGDTAGKFGWWLPSGRYQVIVAKDNWTPQTKNTKLDAGFVNTVDFTLTPFTGCTNGAQRAL